MPRSVHNALQAAFALTVLAAHPAAQERIDPDGIAGGLVLVGGGGTPEAARARFVAWAGGDGARIVVVPSASSRADGDSSGFGDWLEPWQAFGVEELTAVHPSPDAVREADRDALRKATGVWFSGGSQSRIAERFVGTVLEDLVLDVVRRGGVVGGTSAGAAIQSRVMIAQGREEPAIARGLDLLPGAIVDQHFVARNRIGRLQKAVAHHPDRFGVGIDEGTAILVRGRRIEVVGASTATLVLAGTERREARVQVLHAGDIADLTALRRAAQNRAGEDFPGPVATKPAVEAGALILVGGGSLPRPALEQFVALAGGPQARIVLLPIAAPGSEASLESLAARCRALGAAEAIVLSESHPTDVDRDSYLDKIAGATGVWFGGGRQWRFVDAFDGTRALPALRAVLARGGVIAGSSAGASIQGEYMPRGDPLGNQTVSAEGYERGLGFLPGVAVDQHLTERNRLPDLVALVRRVPAFVGLGLDEGTALIVRGRTGTVVGRGRVHVVRAAASPEPEVRAYEAGTSVELSPTGGE
ncbi:MAG: cyanophycinase [Planctomycetota bacterium]